MYKLLSLLVLVALAAFVFAENQDQEAAEQYFARFGYYPSWYNYGFASRLSYPYSYGYSYGYPYAYNYGYNYVY